ncbi:hypothetical protein RRF57_002080 [Xylaria bambusicola]|uniref:Uncharacterized protein n=1 Tax=Xylaria bambusicola TaxID=326684 RepID=A0AAN7U6E9_9PEZI
MMYLTYYMSMAWKPLLRSDTTPWYLSVVIRPLSRTSVRVVRHTVISELRTSLSLTPPPRARTASRYHKDRKEAPQAQYGRQVL